MRRVAVFPNIITTGNMVCGLWAILYCLGGNPDDFKRACWLILLAILLDGLDGIIAVLTKSCSKFGIQYDSLADLVSFAVAPAILLVTDFQIHTEGYLKQSPAHWAMTVILVVCVGLRLARFNLQATSDEKKSFQGLPCPTSAGLISLLLLSFHYYDYRIPSQILLLLVIGLGILMVSSIPYPSLTRADFFKTQPVPTLFLVVLSFAAVLMEPIGIPLLAVFAYILFGLARRFAPHSLRQPLARFVETKKTSAYRRFKT